MKEGYWANYRTGALFLIHEHELWICEPGNAARLGVPAKALAAAAQRHTPQVDRDHFLAGLIKRASIMRIRGHGEMVTFEYHAAAEEKLTDEAFEEILDEASVKVKVANQK